MSQEEPNQNELLIEKNDDEIKDDEITPLEYDISAYPADYTLEGLYLKWKNKDIEMPTFQRSYVWTLVQASKLIESFMMGLPIPPIFFYIQADQKYLVIDGRQRLESVFYFFDGFFDKSDEARSRREFRLEGINTKSRWHRKRFIDFSEEDQRKLKNAVLRSVLVRQLHPSEEDTSIYHIFERLNTGGTPLQDQEVRNCVYAGKLNTLLSDLNRYPSWRKILGKPNPDPRQKDIQLILRYMSLFHNSKQYQKPMKDFLSKFMIKNKNPSEVFIQNEKLLFEKTCDLLIQRLDERPFNPKGPLRPSVFDAVFVAFAKNLDSCPSDIKDRFKKLKDDPQFQKLAGAATTDPEVVTNRLKLAEEVLFG